VEAAAAFVRLEKERDHLRISQEQATKRISELEKKLETYSEMEKSLREAQQREQARNELEKTQVDRLLSLAHVVGRKCFGLMPTLFVLSTADGLCI